jgi:hypothetical protein
LQLIIAKFMNFKVINCIICTLLEHELNIKNNYKLI